MKLGVTFKASMYITSTTNKATTSRMRGFWLAPFFGTVHDRSVDRWGVALYERLELAPNELIMQTSSVLRKHQPNSYHLSGQSNACCSVASAASELG